MHLDALNGHTYYALTVVSVRYSFSSFLPSSIFHSSISLSFLIGQNHLFGIGVPLFNYIGVVYNLLTPKFTYLTVSDGAIDTSTSLEHIPLFTYFISSGRKIPLLRPTACI